MIKDILGGGIFCTLGVAAKCGCGCNCHCNVPGSAYDAGYADGTQHGAEENAQVKKV